MHVTSRVIGTIGLLLCVSAKDNAAAPPQAQPAQRIVPLYASGPRAFAMLTIGDGPPAPVVFDTGTESNLLTENYTRFYHLKHAGSDELVDAATGTRKRTPLVTLAKPSLGGASVAPRRAQIVPKQDPEAVGIFGPGSFAGKLVTLELAQNRLRLAPLSGAQPSGRPTPYRDGLPAADIEVAGNKVSAHLDSGSTGGLSMGKQWMSKLRFKSPPQVVGAAVSALGEQEIYSGTIDGEVHIGPLTLNNPTIEFWGNGDGANVGYKILQRLTVVMDPASQRSWVLDPADLSGSLDQFAGSFGERTVRVRDGKLQYQRQGRPSFGLQYLGGDLFEIPQTGDRIQFFRKDGKVVRLELITAEGQVAAVDRTS